MKYVYSIILILLILNGHLVQAKDTTEPTSLEIEIHKLVNEERARVDNSLTQLQLHSVLIRVAREHSQDMLDNNYFEHVNLDGQSPSDRVSAGGVEWISVAENLYWSSGYSRDQIAEQAVQGWIESPGHYQNMKSDTSYTGIGVSTDGVQYYVTQVFIEGSRSQLNEIGVIYDNANIDNLKVDNDSGGFEIKQEHVIIGLVIGVILLGRYAEGKNRQYRGRNRYTRR